MEKLVNYNEIITHGRGLWKIRRHADFGFAVAITRDGYDILQLNWGSSRNEATVEQFILLLNSKIPPSRTRCHLEKEAEHER